MSHEAANDKHEPRRYSQNFDETVTVIVGPLENQQRFTVHKNLICDQSKFFKAACSKLWAEGKEKVVRLPEAKAGAFQAYVVWVYTGKVVINKSEDESEIRQTIELYLLGDVLDDLRLRNEAMRTLVRKNEKWTVQPPLDLVNEIWESTTPGSRLRQMVVDQTIMRLNRKASAVRVDAFPQDLLRALTISLLDRVPPVEHAKFASGLEKYLEPESIDT